MSLIQGDCYLHKNTTYVTEISFSISPVMRSIGPAVTREQSPAVLRNSNGRLDLPGPTQAALWGGTVYKKCKCLAK